MVVRRKTAKICGFRHMARLLLERRQRGFISSMKGKTMRRFELITVSLIWFAAAIVMPMAALEPAELFDGHRGRVPEARSALRAKAAWHRETIGAIEAKIDAGWSDAAIRDALLGGESLPGLLSRGEYARINMVRAVRAQRK